MRGVGGRSGSLSARFEELAWRETSMGVISLRRRLEPSVKVDVYEVKLGDEFLMSSRFAVAEIELAQLGLAELPDAALPDTALDVVVGGLGLGYTARAVLDDPRVRSLVVVQVLGEVIRWHDPRGAGGGLRHHSGSRGHLPQPADRGELRQHDLHRPVSRSTSTGGPRNRIFRHPKIGGEHRPAGCRRRSGRGANGEW